MATRGKKPLVRVILTEFVQTDPQNFKAIVQKLTGKDAPVSGSSRKRPAENRGRVMEFHEEEGLNLMRADENCFNGVGPVKMENWTVDDFRWLLELPSLDEQAPQCLRNVDFGQHLDYLQNLTRGGFQEIKGNGDSHEIRTVLPRWYVWIELALGSRFLMALVNLDAFLSCRANTRPEVGILWGSVLKMDDTEPLFRIILRRYVWLSRGLGMSLRPAC
ncbi:hypothetical protein EJ110_NYTH03024 [Nymphaea thermarum]|nr:hypothetical protein EJ110_NYTH03024 [Nymphaea thermarum]